MSSGEKESVLTVIDNKYKVAVRGRSYSVTIPKEIAKVLKIKKGDKIKFMFDEENELVIFMKKESMPNFTFNIEGLNKKVMYFNKEHINWEEIGKERAENYIFNFFEQVVKDGCSVRGTAEYNLQLNGHIKQLVDFYNIDIERLIQLFEGKD